MNLNELLKYLDYQSLFFLWIIKSGKRFRIVLFSARVVNCRHSSPGNIKADIFYSLYISSMMKKTFSKQISDLFKLIFGRSLFS